MPSAAHVLRDPPSLQDTAGTSLGALCDALCSAFCEIRPPCSTRLGRLCGALCCAFSEIRPQGRTRLEAICNALCGAFREIRPQYRTLWRHSLRVGGSSGKIMLKIMIIQTQLGTLREHLRRTKTCKNHINAFISASLFDPHSLLFCCKTALKPTKINQFGEK